MQAPTKPNRLRLLAYLFLAYTLLIAYASLSPFTGWRIPAGNALHFLTVWPRYITRHDVLINILAYIPFGLLAALTLHRWRKHDTTAMPIVIAAATGAGLALSLSMETLQVFIPGRVAALPDVLANTAGGLAGAVLARPCLLALHRKIKEPLP